jgi:hypothetical protein
MYTFYIVARSLSTWRGRSNWTTPAGPSILHSLGSNGPHELRLYFVVRYSVQVSKLLENCFNPLLWFQRIPLAPRQPVHKTSNGKIVLVINASFAAMIDGATEALSQSASAVLTPEWCAKECDELDEAAVARRDHVELF